MNSVLRELVISLRELRHGGWSPLYTSNVTRKAKLIGHRRSAINLSHYLLNRADFALDDEIHEFMDFYAKEWESFRSSWAQDAFVRYSIGRSPADRHRKSDFFYLEIGGWDGVTSSNTLSLLESGSWTGMLVEPDKYAYQKLKHFRSSDITLKAAVVPSEYHNDCVMLRRYDMLSHIDGFDSSSDSSSQVFRGAQKVKALGINDIMSGLRHVNYFSLDIEGIEYEILSDLNFACYAPDVVTVECNWDKVAEAKIEELMVSKGYVRRFREHSWLCRGDSWYCKKDMISA